MQEYSTVELKKENEREKWVDIAKFLGVILVFLGHLLYYADFSRLNQFIYSFHIPMFFVLSGYLVKRKETESFCGFIKKKFLRLIVPTIIYVLLTLPVYFIKLESFSLVDFISDLFFFRGLVLYNSPCWYFIVLFEVLLIERLLNIKQSKVIIKSVYLTIFLVAGWLIHDYAIFIPFGLDKAIIATAFLIVGLLVKDFVKSDLFKKAQDKKILGRVLFFLILGALCIILGVVVNPKVSFYRMTLNHFWAFIFSGITGSLAFFIFCKFIEKITFESFCYLGRNSLFIIGTHYVFVTIFEILSGIFEIKYTKVCLLVGIIFIASVVFAYFWVIKFLDKRLPLLLGKRNKK